MSNIKKNFFYSSILTTANYIFPILTYPYVSRVLGVNNIGICNFIRCIINYFILFSMMGIATIGIREVAACKDREERNKIFNGLFFLNTLSTTIMLITLITAIFFIPELYEYKELMFVGAFKLFFNYLLVEWLYKGLEYFKFITIRTLIVKVIYVVSVFVFVRKANDYFVYYLLLSMMVVINAIINILYARKFVTFTFKKLTIRPFVKPFFIFGFYMFLTSMYSSFNVAYLGFVSGEVEVGYFTTATKLFSILLALYTAFTGVLMPRMSNLIREGCWDEFKILLRKSIDILLFFSIPLIIFSIVFAPEIINMISGKGYEGAIVPMRLSMPLILIIGLEQILIIQTLMPLKEDKIILRNSILGASVSLLLNICIVKSLQSVGSTIVWAVSELTVLGFAQYFLNRHYRISLPLRQINRIMFCNIPLIVALLLFHNLPLNVFLSVPMAFIISITYTFILHYYILQTSTVINICQGVWHRFFR